jgi:hypothetical protein
VVKAIQEWKWLLTQRGLRILLGLLNLYNHFLQKFTKVALTLCDNLLEMLSHEWDKLCHQAFGELKNKWYSPCVFKFVEFEVHMGGDFCYGGLLMQVG